MGPIWTRRQMLGASLAAGAGVVLGGCTTREAKKIGGRIQRPSPSATLRIGALGKRSALRRDPHDLILNESDLFILSLVHDPLTIPGPNQAVRGRLASRWQAGLGQTDWQFQLAEGATFHDGSPVTAADVVWSLERLLQRSGARRFSGIESGSIEADGEGTVLVRVDRPNGKVHELLRTFTFTVPEGSDDAADAPGTGPFKLDSYDDGDARLIRNEKWHGGHPAVAVIEVTLFESPQELAAAVLDGEIDLASNVGAEAAEVVTEGSDAHVFRRPHELSLPLVMRVADGPFADVRVREAVRLAVDRPALVEEVFRGAGRPGNDIVGTADPLYAQEFPQRALDLEEADRLLTEAGFDRSATHQLPFPEAEPLAGVAARTLQAQLAEVGLSVIAAGQPQDVFDTQTWGQAPLYLTSNRLNDSVAVWAWEHLRSDGRANETGFADSAFDRTFDAAVKEFESDARLELYHEVQDIERQRSGYLVWGVGDGVDVVSNKVFDLPRTGGYGRFALEATWIDR